MFGNVAPTPSDFRFSLLGVPVRVHPLFWLVSLVMGLKLGSELLPIWVAVVFVSIVVHEMGHALMIRSCGWRPSIVLYTFGGLAMYQPTHRDPSKQILISLAGPAAGFSLAILLVLLLNATGHPVKFHFDKTIGVGWSVEGITNRNLFALIEFLLFVNIWWGLMNLLPVYPLDGGQALRELFYVLRVPDALIVSLWISVFAGAAVAVYAFVRLQQYYIAMLFGFLAYSSLQMVQAYQGRGGGYDRW